MHRWIRLKLDMACRSSALGRQHPTATVAIGEHQRVLDRLIQDVEAMEYDAARWEQARTAAVATRQQVRSEIWGLELRAITDIAAVASAYVRGIAGRFTLPPFRVCDRRFALEVRRIAAEAIQEREALEQHGLSRSVPIAALERLKEWQAADRRAVECRLRRVGARAAVAARTGEMMREITILEQLYRYEFRARPAILAAWRSARRIAWPAHTEAGRQAMTEHGEEARR